MDNAVPEGGQRWLATIAQLPVEDPASRMRVLRTLESLGAAVMREGAYLLPDSADNRRAAALMAGQECMVDPSEVLPDARPARGQGHRYRQQERHDRRPPGHADRPRGPEPVGRTMT